VSRRGTAVARPGLAPAVPYVVLALAVMAVYAPVRHFAFINFDDGLYVTDNPAVRSGLTWETVRWALTTDQAAFWHPLTWLSHMLDVELFGLDAGGHHATNVVLHAANALVLLAVLTRLTGAPLASAWVAGMFALHPLHVESVAWVAERKDVLSTLFGLLAVWAYLRAVEAPTRARRAAVALLFAASLMAKPMLVTLPAILLLLDWWPLGRLSLTPASVWLRVREKLPLLVLAVLAGIVTFIAQRGGGAMAALETVPAEARMLNALVSYWRYVGATVWPARLAIFYPYVFLPAWQGVVAGAALAAATAGALAGGRERPYLAVGWLWFLVTLVPVIGLVQVGAQAWADRFSYLPGVGLFLVVAFSVRELAPRAGRAGTATLALAALVACGAASAAQVRTWRDSETVFRQALAVTERNDVAHLNLGVALAGQGRIDEATEHYREAARLNDRSADAHNNLGNVALRARRWSEAESHFRAALRVRPDFATAENGLGVALANGGDLDAAIVHYQEALRRKPEYLEAQVNLGNALLRVGRPADATRAYRAAVDRAPREAVARYGLGNAFAAQGEAEHALAEYDQAVTLRPDWPEAQLRRGEVLLRLGRAEDAGNAFRAALRARPGWPPAESALDALESGR
jgi:tetratricopeptide (TPR) repeat protein